MKRYIKVTIMIIVSLILLAGLTVYATVSPYFSHGTTIEENNSEYKNTDTVLVQPDIIDDANSSKNLTEVETADSNTEQIIFKEEQIEDTIINIALVGLDAREYNTVSRSDTIILLSYNSTKNDIKLVSFLRDTYVYIPDTGWNRINAATVYGGTASLINTLNYTFGLDIQDFVEIKFDDFKHAIDIIGGLDIELDKSEIEYINWKLHSEDRDYANDVTAKPGIVHLNGTQLLWHCRNRSVGNGDFSRTDRQREVLSLLIEKAHSLGAKDLIELVVVLRGSANTNMNIGTIIELATSALKSNLSISSMSIPADGMFRYSNINGASVIEINQEETIEYLHNFIGYQHDVADNIEVSD